MSSHHQKLGACLAMPFLGPRSKKRMFTGEYYVSSATIIPATVLAFQKAAVLGYALRDKFGLLCQLLTHSEDTAETVTFLTEEVRDQISRSYRSDITFFEFVTAIEFPTLQLNDPTLLKKLSSDTTRLGVVIERCSMSGANGVAFGAICHAEFLQLWKNSYEEINVASWNRARTAGLDIPTKPTPLSLADATPPILTETASYAQDFSPRLLTPLGLHTYLIS